MNHEILYENSKAYLTSDNDLLEVKLTKTHPDAITPTYAHSSDGGMDLTAVTMDSSKEEYVEYDTGISLAIPNGFVGLVYPRSSISKYDLILANHVGVIDSSYRGSIKLRFRAGGENIYKVGDRIAQLIIIPRPQVSFNVVEELDETQRQEGAFGSTDHKEASN